MTWRSGYGRVAGLAVILAAGLTAGAAAQSPFPAEADLAVMLHYLVEDGATPGIVFGVLEADGGTRILGAGSGGPGQGPPGPSTAFEIGSITKTFTATLLADMVGRGEVSLDDPVSVYLPESVRVPSRDGREITLLDLATHRSGLPSLPVDFIPSDFADPYAGYTIGQLYEYLSGHDLRRAPGEEVEYSNLGYGLLGHALARAAETPYRDLLRARVLEPLGMTATGWAADGGGGDVARGHRHGRIVAPWTTGEAFDGAGGLRSTATDLLRYLAANVDAADHDLARAMREAHRPRADFSETERIGLGWRTEARQGRTSVRHGGVSGGFSAMVAFDPEAGTGFVRLANSRDFPDYLGLFFLHAGPPLAVAEVDVPRETLRRYSGTYEVGPARFFIRFEPDGTLTAQGGPNQVRFRMYAESDSAFYVKRVLGRLSFRTDGTGAVTALVLGTRTLLRVSDDTPPPGLPAPRILDLPLAPAELARYEGTYDLSTPGGAVEVRIHADDGHLLGRIRDGAATRLLHQGDHEFVLEADTDFRVAFTFERDRITGMRVSLGGVLLPGERRP